MFPAEPELWQQQRNPIALFALHHRDDLARLLRTWQAAHEYADRHPDEADKLIAFREKLSVPRFRQAEQALNQP